MWGDKSIEKLWPAIKHEAHWAILIIDWKTTKHDNVIDDWVNWFCGSTIDIDNMICISYTKESSK